MAADCCGGMRSWRTPDTIINQERAWKLGDWASFYTEGELYTADDELNGDDEPSLGAVNSHHHQDGSAWAGAGSSGHDLEADAGDEPEAEASFD